MAKKRARLRRGKRPSAKYVWMKSFRCMSPALARDIAKVIGLKSKDGNFYSFQRLCSDALTEKCARDLGEE